MKKGLLIFGAAILVLASCKKEDDSDTEAPSFASIKMNSVEMIGVDESEVDNGDGLEFDIMTSDNEGLSQLSVSIHEGEGHEHRSKKSGEEALTFGPEIYSLSGNSATTHVHVSDALANEAVEYHLELQLLDAAGNSTTNIQVFHIHDDGEDHAHEEGEDHVH